MGAGVVFDIPFYIKGFALASRKQNSERTSVIGAKTAFSKGFVDSKFPTVFRRNSPNMAHRAVFTILGWILNFRKSPLIATTPNINRLTRIEILSKNTISDASFSLPLQIISKGMIRSSISP